ncbi:hypothetical protein BHM03_00061995, partial [Ensete ventricosum]
GGFKSMRAAPKTRMEVSIWRRIKGNVMDYQCGYCSASGSLFYMISSGNLNPVADPMKKKRYSRRHKRSRSP